MRTVLASPTWDNRGRGRCKDTLPALKDRWARVGDLLPTGSEEREVLGVGSIPVAILPSCQDMKTITL